MKYIVAFVALILSVYYLYQVKYKSTRVVWLIYFELIYNLIIKFIIGNLGFPSVLNYVSDMVLLWIIFEFLMQNGRKELIVPKSMKIGCLILFLISIVSYVLNLYSPFLYIWGFRNNFRFIIFAIMCAVYLDRRDIKTIFDILYGFILVNIIATTYQYFFVSYNVLSKGDFISGLFSNGAERGGNASLNWLLCIVCTYVIVQYLNKEEKLHKLLICLCSSIYMAALAEIKLFFIQLVIIGALAIILCRKSLKAFGVVLIGVTSLVVGIRLLYYAFPSFANFFNVKDILAYVSEGGGYAGTGVNARIDRLTAIPYVFEHFLPSALKKAVGIGLGNADYSSFSFLTSSFYNINNWTGYTFFYSAFITVELGIVGLVTYLGIILNYFRKAVLVKSKMSGDKTIKQFVIIMSVICLIMIFSNQTMKLEASAYLVHCVLAFPFVISKTSDNTQGNYSKIKKIRFRILR